MAWRWKALYICIILYLAICVSTNVAQNVDGGWSPWQVDPDIDCCMYGPYAQYKRYCNNPSPEGTGAKCLKADGVTYADIEDQWRTCDCGCNPLCDNNSSFCANDTGRPAYCQCNYGFMVPPGSDPNAITTCVVAVTTTERYTTTAPDVELDSNTKNILNAVGYATGAFLIICLILCLVLNLITGNLGKDRLIQMCEEITLLAVHLLILLGAEAVSSAGFCQATSILLHYLFMCTMAFFCVEALHAYSMITYVVPANGYFPWFVNILLGFGVPLIPLAFALGFQFNDYGTNGKHCWCNLSTFQSWSFLFPIGFAGFVCTIIAEAQGQGKYHALPETDTNQYVNARISQASLMFVMLLSLCSYIFGLIAVHMQSVVMFSMFYVDNVFLGVVILFFHTASSAKIRAISEKICFCFRCCMKDVEKHPSTANRPPTANKISPYPNEEKEHIPDEEIRNEQMPEHENVPGEEINH